MGEWESLLTGDAEEMSWQERALCAQTDPEAFFPLLHDERFGIWGGLSERERRKLKKRAG